MATAKKATKKKTGGSAAAKAKFKANIAKAKKIYKANPKKKWPSCVKEAFKK